MPLAGLCSYLAIGSDTPRAEAVAGVAALHHRGGPFDGRVDRTTTHPPRRSFRQERSNSANVIFKTAPPLVLAPKKRGC
jgi:hypothetical protein